MNRCDHSADIPIFLTNRIKKLFSQNITCNLSGIPMHTDEGGYLAATISQDPFLESSWKMGTLERSLTKMVAVRSQDYGELILRFEENSHMRIYMNCDVYYIIYMYIELVKESKEEEQRVSQMVWLSPNRKKGIQQK